MAEGGVVVNINTKTDYKFLDEPDEDLKCAICKGVAAEPWQHSKCGKLFCSSCLTEHGRQNPCPECKTAKGEQYFEDNRSKKNISNLRVQCHNEGRGCKWEGTVSTLEEHLSACQLALVPCPKQCKDSADGTTFVLVVAQDLEKHLAEDCPNRDTECEHCHKVGTHTEIMQTHRLTCDMLPVPCSNGECGSMIKRCALQQHLETECDYAEISCPYQSLGCTVRMVRRDMRAHLQVQGLEEGTGGGDGSGGSAQHLRLALDTVTELKRTSGETKHLLDEALGALAELKRSTSSNSVQILPAPKSEVNSAVFKVSNFQQKLAVKAKFVSPGFHTGPNGYSIVVRVDVSGHGQGAGSHVSLFALVRKSEYDAELRWPFEGKVTFALLNQLDDREHFEKALTIEAAHGVRPGDLGRGFFNFVPHSLLDHDPVKNTQYLKDDTLYFRVSVEVADHKPWLQCNIVN